ncbi:MAG: hypothetical protein IJV20_10625 [Prevotella sp.]|nr:hypothetical protein [Prevotella sp.]
MKQFLVLFLFLCSASVFAQDVIVKKDGSTIVCRVVALTSSEIVYKKWSDLNGPNYVMNRSDASAINYQNGKKVNLSEVTNLYQPHNQNDGVQQYNDRALLGIDNANQQAYKKARNLRTWGWISGIAGVGLGALFVNIGLNADYDEDMVKYCIVGGVLAAGGITTSTYCFVNAHKKQRQAEMYLQSSTLYQYNFEFNNGSNLSAGIDILRDRNIGNNTLGIGLRYNF